jgi:hypothetical protein
VTARSLEWGNSAPRRRRLEQLIPGDVAALADTVCGYDRADCGRALRATIALYQELRQAHAIVRRDAAAAAAIAYLDAVLQ